MSVYHYFMEGSQDRAISLKDGLCCFLVACFVFLIPSCCKINVVKVVDRLGYAYDDRQDVYVSKVDAWQRKMGYASLYDLSAASTSMIIDCEPIKFEYNGQPYMIELWKGQYGLSTGSEIGIYKKTSADMTLWECGEDADMLEMSYSLKKNAKEVFARSGRHWWLTGFKPGEFSNPQDLTMDIVINLSDHPDMLNPFLNGLKKIGYEDNQLMLEGNTVKFRFDRPKTPQPLTDESMIAEIQKNNKRLVDLYNQAKKEVGVTDNSPKSIEKMVDQVPELTKHLVKGGLRK